MAGKYLLDTNVVIGLFDQQQAILERIAAAEETLVPVPVTGELFHGAFNSQRSRANVERIEALSQSHPILPLDLETARNYGLIKSALRRKGKPIPDNDIWIAALAQQHEATIATRDAHFDEIDGLAVERW